MKSFSVEILGANYSGFTLFCEFLCGIENSFNVGESHWIFDRKDYELCMDIGCFIFTHKGLNQQIYCDSISKSIVENSKICRDIEHMILDMDKN